MAESDNKYKGVKGHNPRGGMGRLRRANSKDIARVGPLDRHDEDAEVFDRLATRSHSSHGGESLLAKFNRLAGNETARPGEPVEICGFAGAEVLVRDSAGKEFPCVVRQVLKKRIAGVKNPLCVGDRVRVEHQLDGNAAVVAVEPRRNQLERTDSHNRSLIHVFAANIDCLVIMSSLHEPDLKTGLIDRYLIIAAANSIPAALVINKIDLGNPQFICALYRSIDLPCFATTCSGHSESGIAEVREFLRGKTCVIAGQSGVGKSSLVNSLYPELRARTGLVAEAGHGRHTTTSSRSYLMADGGRLIDTPGIRECSITGLTPLDVSLLYPDMAKFHRLCRFQDCSHIHEPDCAVRAAYISGALAPSRYESYCAIIREDLATG